MPEDNSSSTATSTAFQADLNVPEETQKQFGDLVAMIRKSRSMNDEEKQYWVDVLPIMTKEQVTNLREILENEQKQVAEAEARRNKAINDTIKKTAKAFDEEAYRQKKLMRVKAEKEAEEKEKKDEAELLEKLQEL